MAAVVQIVSRMRTRPIIFCIFVLWFMELCHLAAGRKVQLDKVEATIPMNTRSPPEGNTTFLGGTTWCVARPTVSQVDLQNALDWACGRGMAECTRIQEGRPCFQPNTLISHASYAFNSYYQQNGNSDIACNFGGTAYITNKDPSYGKCDYATSGSLMASGHMIRPSISIWSRFHLGLLLLIVCMWR